jgi:ABC-2 type transport system permease protein
MSARAHRAQAPSALRMLASQVRAEQRIFWRNPSVVFFTFVFPLLLLFFFSSFANARTLVPGIAALVIVSTSFQALGISLSFHREQGVLKRLLATPLPVPVMMAAKIASIACVALLEIVLVVAVGVARFDLPLPQHAAVFVAMVVLGVAAFASMGIGLAAAIPNGESAPAVTNAVYLPMMFVSAVFYPLHRMPDWLAWVGRVLPLYHLVEPLRHAWTGNPSKLAVHVGVLAGWGLVAAVYASTSFRLGPHDER